MIKVTTSNVQEVKAEILKLIREFTDSGFVTVGIHEDTGNHPDSDETNASIGAKLHYGKWPFLDLGVESGIQDYLNVLKLDVENGSTLEEALDEIGQEAAGNVQVFMTRLKTPPNSEATIERKGDNNPLIDDGHLRAAVASKVQIETPQEGSL